MRHQISFRSQFLVVRRQGKRSGRRTWKVKICASRLREWLIRTGSHGLLGKAREYQNIRLSMNGLREAVRRFQQEEFE